jgi:HSP20 family protein
MALVRWEPVRINSLQSEMNRLFNTFFDTPTGAGNGSPRRFLPSMDLAETETQYVLKADLPGVAEGDVAIELRDNVLTVSGERKVEQEEKREGYHRVERSFGHFRRSLTLPDGVDADAIAATFDKGVLEIRIPKPEARKPRTVEIKVGAAAPALEASESKSE